MARPLIKPNSKAGITPASPLSPFKSSIKAKELIPQAIIPKKQPAPKTPNELLYYGFHAVRAIFKTRRQDIIRAYCTEERLNDMGEDRKSTRLNSSHIQKSRMPSSA